MTRIKRIMSSIFNDLPSFFKTIWFSYLFIPTI